MEEATLPEEIIVHIVTRLPVKSLLRFTCVSKRFHSIILSDPKFAKSQLQAARDRNTHTQRLLYSADGPRFKSLDLETPSFGDPSSVRELQLPFQPDSKCVTLLGSCNGIVFLTNNKEVYYMWNPSTRFFNRLPDPGFSPSQRALEFYGVGYLPATDDYKDFVVSPELLNSKNILSHIPNEAAIYSSGSNAWKTFEFDALPVMDWDCQGTLLKEALHWLGTQNQIVAFDLAQEEQHKFRKMQLPPNLHNGRGGGNYSNRFSVSAVGGCLSLARYQRAAIDCIDVWVMKEYDVHDSWTKLYNLKLSDPLKERWNFSRVYIMEASVVAEIFSRVLMRELVKIDQTGEDNMIEGDWNDMVQYEESLLRIDH
ncbi:PREDICTED: F-box protein CPR30-like [Fragaria vesca subsp. vesca]|uniref:F-box protein CPR30-like n=1 Tax=Fragaria vesca subsp. vesca TaxID=101020 RepID=UPI0002C32393|nr:PREDICTED: F-box protein CPR30-like [Fragaria vesca subsp. vesca]